MEAEAESLVVQGGVHFLVNPPQDADLPPHRLADRVQRLIDACPVSGSQSARRFVDRRENLRRDRLDLEVQGKSPYERIAHLIGVEVGGPRNLSERTGRRFASLLRKRERARR